MGIFQMRFFSLNIEGKISFEMKSPFNSGKMVGEKL